MERIEPDGPVMFTERPWKLISTDKVTLELHEGSIWVRLIRDGERVGVAFLGPSRFAVDAITETDAGAMGRSIAVPLGGVQLLFGENKADEDLREASGEELESLGFHDASAFLEKVKSVIDDKIRIGKVGRFKQRDGKILLGSDAGGEPVTLVLRGDDIVFTLGKDVYVVSDRGLVSVHESGVTIGSRSGHSITVGKDGIRGLNVECITTKVPFDFKRAMGRMGLRFSSGPRHFCCDWRPSKFEWNFE